MRQFKQPKRIYNSPSDSSPSSSAHSEESESSSNSSTVGDFENETIYMPKTPKRRTEVQERGKLKYHHEDNLFRRMSVENLVRGDKILRITSDKYMDIKWSDLSVNGYLIFLQQVEQFSLKNQQHVKYLLPLVEDRLMESVMSEIQLYFPREYRTRRDMLQISVEHLTAVVQLMLVPNSRQHFLLQLKRSCKDCGVEQGSFESYKSVKSKLCGLRTKFLDRYDFLKDACELAGRRNCIPYNTFKDGGVLWTWMDLTPVKARNNFKLDLSHRHWDDLRGFLKDFFKIVDKTARQAEAALAYEYAVGIKGGKQSDIDKPIVHPDRDQRVRRQESISERKRLTLLEDENGEYVRNQSEYQHLRERDMSDNAFEHESDPTQQDQEAPEDDDDFEQQFAQAMVLEKSTEKMPCHKMLFNDTCSNGDRCKYSHDQTLLDAEWSRLCEKRRKLRGTRYDVDSSAVQSTVPSSVVALNQRRRNQPGYQLQQTQGGKKAQEFQILQRQESMLGIVSGLFLTGDKPESWKAAHLMADASTDGLHFFQIGVALFDSGASADNYISSGTIEKFNLHDKVQLSDSQVKVADVVLFRFVDMWSLLCVLQVLVGNGYRQG